MCWSGAASMVMNAGQNISSGIWTKMSLDTQAKQLEYQANMSDIERDLVDQTGQRNVEAATEEGRQELIKMRMLSLRTQGQQKAAQAASGIGGGSVTAEDVAMDTFRQTNIDEMAIRYNSDLKTSAIKYDTTYKKWGLLNQANAFRHAAKYTKHVGKWAMGSGFLGGATSGFSTYYGYKTGAATGSA